MYACKSNRIAYLKKPKLKIMKIEYTPTRRLNKADLPTFGLPTIATLGRRWSGIYKLKQQLLSVLPFKVVLNHQR